MGCSPQGKTNANKKPDLTLAYINIIEFDEIFEEAQVPLNKIMDLYEEFYHK